MLRTLDLFSGIGGFSLGLEDTGGFETAGFCEIEPSCRHLLSHHWPGVPCHGDIKALTADMAGDIDVICGGFPCQDLSYAGKGAGLDGSRSGLWFEIPRLLREFAAAGRPVRYVILENVPALLSRGLGVVLRDLAACGFDAEWDCIPASALGAPHRRDRIWIVAYARSVEHEGFGDAFRRALATELHGASMAYAESQCGCGCGCGTEPSGWCQPANGSENVADSTGRGPRRGGPKSHEKPIYGGEVWALADAARQRFPEGAGISTLSIRGMACRRQSSGGPRRTPRMGAKRRSFTRAASRLFPMRLAFRHRLVGR